MSTHDLITMPLIHKELVNESFDGVVTKMPENSNENAAKRGRTRLYQNGAKRVEAFRKRKKLCALFPPLPPGPYRVLYADPPWQYENDGMKKYGHAAFHYPTLSIEALCALPIKGISEKNAVLFLWVTAPILFEAAPVLKAWGFEYKTHLVWDKGRHNFGFYVGVQTELLLVATRGTCRPDVHVLPSNLRKIPRTEHSTKPEEFRHLIDMLYPEGRRLELFARRKVDGWDAWGKEVEVNEGDCDGDG